MVSFSLSQFPGNEWFVYLISCTTMPGVHKIGMSTNPKSRLKDIQSKYPAHRFELLHYIAYEPAGRLERAIHKYYSRSAFGHEWFYLTLQDVLQFKSTTVGQFFAGRYGLSDTLTHIAKRSAALCGDAPKGE